MRCYIRVCTSLDVGVTGSTDVHGFNLITDKLPSKKVLPVSTPTHRTRTSFFLPLGFCFNNGKISNISRGRKKSIQSPQVQACHRSLSFLAHGQGRFIIPLPLDYFEAVLQHRIVLFGSGLNTTLTMRLCLWKRGGYFHKITLDSCGAFHFPGASSPFVLRCP